MAAETFVGALASLRGFVLGAGDPRAWLLGIARHKLIDAMHRQTAEERADRAVAMQPGLVDDEASTTIDLIASIDVLNRLDELPSEQRDPIVAHFIDGLSYAEIAASWGCPERVVRERASRGLNALRRALSEPPS